MIKSNQETAGFWAIVIASIIWGTTGTAASFTQGVSPLATGAFATGIGGILLCIVARRSIMHELTQLKANKPLLLLGALSIAVYPLTFYLSMQLAGVAIGTVVSIAMAPIFTKVMERFINRQLISLRWVLSFILGALGVVLLMKGKRVTVSAGEFAKGEGELFLGVLLGLIAALSYAVYSWAAKQLIRKEISSQSSVASMFGLAAILLLSSLFITGENLLTGTTNISVALYMAVIPMFVGYLLFGFGLRHLDASKATLITLLEPVVATLLATAIVGERFLAIGWVGMMLIVGCIVLQVLPNSLPRKSGLLLLKGRWARNQVSSSKR